MVRESSSPSWQIEQQCPQCGAPLIIEETDRILSCRYCRVKMYIAFRNHARCYFPCDSNLKDVLFVPYWRFRGLIFSTTENEIQPRIVDSNHIAVASKAFPPTLGVRPQVLRMRFAAPRPEGKLLEPDLPLKVSSFSVDDSFGGISEVDDRGRHEAFIGEAASLIYSPFFVRDSSLCDGVLKRPLSIADAQYFQELTYDSSFDWTMSFVPTLCPRCGWDLEGERDSLILLCRNCDSAWEHSLGKFSEVEFAFLPPLDDEPALHLPFWRIQARFEGLRLDTCGDLARLANMPRVSRSSEDDRRLFFWIPGFKIQPQSFLRLAKVMTTCRPREEFKGALPKSSFHPVTLPSGEAAESLKTLLASMAVPKRLFFPLLPKIRVIVEKALLFYYPFKLKGSEYVQPGIPISINRNALGWGRLI